MKKLLFTIFSCLLFSGAFAQFEQGTILVGGNTNLSAGFLTEKGKSGGNTQTLGKYTVISVTPQAGYFVADNLAVGAGINLTSTSFKPDAGSGKQTSSSFVFEPLVRYYFSGGLYGQGQFGFGSQKQKFDDGTTSTTTTAGVSQWALSIGYAVLLNESVAIEPSIGYGSQTIKTKNPEVKDIYSGLAINVGVFVYLKR